MAASRRVGVLGRLARAAVGGALVGSVVVGHMAGGFHAAPWVLGLVGFPTALLGQHAWRSRRSPAPLRATGPLGQAVGPLLFLALYLTWWYAPVLDVTSDAALLFFGSSMLLAAAQGCPGCEMLAFSNWVLGREDEVGCALFQPVDRLATGGG